MSNTVVTIVSKTPTWVYILFLFLLYRGITALKPRTVTLKKLLILPILFTGLSLHMLLTTFNINASLITSWVISIFVGSTIGWCLVRNQIIVIDKNKWLFQLPGSVMTLIIIFLVFVSKYTIDFQLGAHPQLHHSTIFSIISAIVSGLCTGLFIGRLGNYLYRYRIYPQSQSEESVA